MKPKLHSQPQEPPAQSSYIAEQSLSSRNGVNHSTDEPSSTPCQAFECSRNASFGAVGDRIYFSFSAALCSKCAKKAAARVAAVPDDRVLLETDLSELDGMNDALLEIAEFVAQAKGWTLEHTVDQTWRNFKAFYCWEALG
ncbi:MAG: hypothetical protein HC767_03095 [Akkermansiaceae bacterium]|nr:hypothetical protein [Akkermansiaceae bacterium]